MDVLRPASLSVVGQVDPFVSMAQAKAHLRVAHADDDEVIALQIVSVCAYLNGPDGILNRALSSMALQASFACPKPSDVLDLSLGGAAFEADRSPPVSRVSFIRPDRSAAELHLSAVYTTLQHGILRVGAVDQWPAMLASHPSPLVLLFRVGPQEPDERAIALALLMIGQLYEFREEQVDASGLRRNVAVQRLIDVLKVRRIR